MAELDTAPGFESYNGAIEWFRSRVPMAEADARDLSARARERAFWAAGAATAAQAEALQESLARAMTGGQPMQEWVKTARGILTQSSTQHLETIFRTNTQAAYSVARQTQMYAPAVLRRRPWGYVQTVDDQRRSKICKGFAGTLMPLDDPGWLKRWPPYHHRCRTTIRNLTDAQAEKLGGATGWPSVMPATGFGSAKGMVGRGQTDSIDQALRDVLEERRIQETIEPLEASPEVNIEGPRLVSDALRKLNLDKTIRTPQALKRFVGVDRETFGEGQVRVKTESDGSINIFARNDRLQVNRTVRPDGSVFHDSIRIAEQLRGQGIARYILKTAAEEYAKAGITKVELLADEDGKYVWPKMGFRAAPEQTAKQSEKFDAWLRTQGDTPIGAKQMHDIAVHPRGEQWLKTNAPIMYYEIGVDELRGRLAQ